MRDSTDRLLAPRLPFPEVTPGIGAMRGWQQGESGWPAWRGRVSGARGGNKDKITFLLHDLEERDNCP